MEVREHKANPSQLWCNSIFQKAHLTYHLWYWPSSSVNRQPSMDYVSVYCMQKKFFFVRY